MKKFTLFLTIFIVIFTVGCDVTDEVTDERSQVIQEIPEEQTSQEIREIEILHPWSVSDKFKDEEVYSNYTYPEEYKGPKPIKEQVKALVEIFELSPDLALKYIKEVLPTLTLPDDAEGWFAIPSVDALAAKFFPEVTNPAEKYCRAVQMVHQKIADSRTFYNYCEGEITSDRLQVHAHTAEAMKLITETGDILIIASQLGMRHRGKSVRRAREVFTAGEFGLTSLAVGSIILTHPERLVRSRELDMYPSGDVSRNVDGYFVRVPSFRFGDYLRFNICSAGCPSVLCGSVTAFLPQAI